MDLKQFSSLSRRRFVTGSVAGAALMGIGLNTKAAETYVRPKVLAGNNFDLSIGYQSVNFTGTQRQATTVNGSLPAPILRWKEGASAPERE